MHAQSKFYILPHGNGFDALEVHACREEDRGEVRRLDSDEDLIHGDFFTVYGCEIGAGLVEYGDFTTFEAACAVAEKLGGVAEKTYALGYYVKNVLKSRKFGFTYKHAGAPTTFDHGDIRFSFQGYGRSLQGGGNKWKAYAYRGTQPVPTKELLKIK